MVCQMNRIASHLVWLATGGLELGAILMMPYGFREREMLLDIFDMLTGLRMNHAYIRIAGLVMDLPPGADDRIREFLRIMPGRIKEYENILSDNPIWLERNRGVGFLSVEEPSRSASPVRSFERQVSHGTSGKTSPTAATRRMSSVCRCGTRPTATRGSRSAWRR